VGPGGCRCPPPQSWSACHRLPSQPWSTDKIVATARPGQGQARPGPGQARSGLYRPGQGQVRSGPRPGLIGPGQARPARLKIGQVRPVGQCSGQGQVRARPGQVRARARPGLRAVRARPGPGSPCTIAVRAYATICRACVSAHVGEHVECMCVYVSDVYVSM
jgi:hypothetical protein